MPESEREAFAARLCGYDPSLTDQLPELVEGLANLVSERAAGKVRGPLARLLLGEGVMARALAALVSPGAVAIAAPANDPALAQPEYGRPFQFPFFIEPGS